jgi:ribosomal protein S18 acetylase RimI-like enzyme
LAFGQYYLRLGNCHLGRLIVNPNFRGQGIASHLINQLSTLGRSDLRTDSCSLFVLGHNKSAIKVYTKLGFSMADYPEEIPLKNCFYMVQV